MTHANNQQTRLYQLYYNTSFMSHTHHLQGAQLYSLIVVRVLMGWYFLYEGMIKLLNPGWSSYGFLISSEGWLADVFKNLAMNPSTVEIINFLNIWGLIAIGTGLMLGLLSRIASLSGALLVLLYYLSHPPLIESSQTMMNGHALWVDRNLIFISVLVVLSLFPTSHIIGIDRLLFKIARTSPL